MKCLICGNLETKVVDSRLNSEANNIRRRRECIGCGFRFSTLEESIILDLVVIKKNEKREPYNKEKIEKGLYKALEKRDYNCEAFAKLLSKIETEIQKKKKSEIESQEIGDIIMKELKEFDPIAYIRFASVYKSYDDIMQFAQELDKLK